MSRIQLPHIGEAEARTICTTSVPGKPAVKGIAQYIKLPREERKVATHETCQLLLLLLAFRLHDVQEVTQ